MLSSNHIQTSLKLPGQLLGVWQLLPSKSDASALQTKMATLHCHVTDGLRIPGHVNDAQVQRQLSGGLEQGALPGHSMVGKAPLSHL